MSDTNPADSTATDSPPRRSLRAVWVLLGLVVLALLAYSPVRQFLEAERRKTCKNNMKQLGLALANYHDEYGSFPPAYTLDAEGKRMHSWRVLILPQLGEDELYAAYRFDEPWDGPHNRKLFEQAPAVFACPSHGDASAGRTRYLAVVSPRTAWPEQYAASIRDILDGVHNTIMVVERNDSDVLWMEPRDVSLSEAQQTPLSVSHPPDAESGIQHVLLAGGSVHAVSSEIDADTYRSLLSAYGGAPFPGVEWPLELLAGSYDFGPELSSEQLPTTDVVPYTSGPIIEGRNYLYCATFQIAWDDFRSLVGGVPIRLKGDPPFAAAMNAESFPRTALSEDSYVARGGLVRDGILKDIAAGMSKKFPNARPGILASPPSHQGVAFYAYLRKDLPFREKFDRLPDPLQFTTTSGKHAVAAFGLPETDAEAIVREQVTVLDHISDDDFILRIETANRQDEIVLAKVVPGKTFAETLADVHARIKSPDATHTRREVEEGEPVALPVLTLNVKRAFNEIYRGAIEHPELADLSITRATQIIRFRLDEAGAQLESEAEIIGEFGEDEPPPPPMPRRFIFDRPHLILLQELGATAPYFAAWIGNAELMEAE
ncbi:MAG: hypothetical protein CMJ48_05125 [Planctomycetaceae bacterium]|nr:hypothetical protein [Planctomycetaceae bacterium]